MKRRGIFSLISLILAVALVITALSSCSANNSSLILCNVKLDTSNASRSFDVTRSTLLTNDNMYYKAVYYGNDSAYYGNTDDYIKYTKTDGILLSQGYWEILCQWIDKTGIIATGSTGKIFVNLNTTSLYVYLGDGYTGNVQFEYVVYPSNDYKAPYIVASITGIDNPSYSFNNPTSLKGNTYILTEVTSMPKGKYLFTVNVYDDSSNKNLLFTDLLGFVVRSGITTTVEGVLKDLPQKAGTTDSTYMEDYYDDNSNTTINGGTSIPTGNNGGNEKKLNEGSISNNNIYVINGDGITNNMDLGHTDSNNNQSNRIKVNATESTPVNFGINLAGKNVVVTTNNYDITENTTVVELNEYSTMNIYNYVNGGAPEATWGVSDDGYQRRYHANVAINGGTLNVIGPSGENSISNGKVVFQGPLHSDSDILDTAGNGKTAKQGSINIYSPGGNVILDGDVEVIGHTGISSWNADTSTSSTLTGESNTSIIMKNGAKIVSTGDYHTSSTGYYKYYDIAYGIKLKGNNTSINSHIDIVLDNGSIITSNVDNTNDTAEAGIDISNFNGDISIVLKNHSIINTHGSVIRLSNCTGKVTVIIDDTVTFKNINYLIELSKTEITLVKDGKTQTVKSSIK